MCLIGMLAVEPQLQGSGFGKRMLQHAGSVRTTTVRCGAFAHEWWYRRAASCWRFICAAATGVAANCRNIRWRRGRPTVAHRSDDRDAGKNRGVSHDAAVPLIKVAAAPALQSRFSRETCAVAGAGVHLTR